MRTLKRKVLIAASIAALPAVLAWTGEAAALTPLEQLGKKVFNDAISRPEDAQACASCHDQAKGWTLPNSKINQTTVSAPGARVKRSGSLKPPSNAYASFSPVFRANSLSAGLFEGGNFWDGRAEGFGAISNSVQVGDANVSKTVRLEDIPLSKQNLYKQYLGPTADQALNPFPNSVEQNVRIKRVCKNVRDANYSYLYTQAYGVAIDCSGVGDLDAAPGSPASISFKRIALALAAWQASTDVNAFSSQRDVALKRNRTFPNSRLSFEANLGHDIFYGRNDTGCNRTVTSGPLAGLPLNAFCAACHSGMPGQSGPTNAPPLGNGADPQGVDARQLYTDNFYHNIGLPYNREVRQTINGANNVAVNFREKKGLNSHASSAPEGFFRTPTLRNVDKGATKNFTKAYMHNGYFKNLKDVVHFYNTRDVKNDCATIGIVNASAAEALQNDCWPKGEFEESKAGFIIGNLGLAEVSCNGKTYDEEDALVAYLKTLSDK